MLFGIPGMRVFLSEPRLLRCPSGETLPCFYAGSATSGWLSRAGDVSSHSGPWDEILLVCAGRTGSRRGMETRVMSSCVF